MEKECDVITLEDGIDYVIVDEIVNEGTKYLYLVNKNDEKDFCVRKLIIEDGEEYVSGLDSTEEFNKTISIFANKYNEK